MSFLTKTPKAPYIPPPPLPPAPISREGEETAAGMKEAEERQRRKAALRKGRKSTLLTGQAGVMGAAPIARKTLLGQ